MAPIELTQSGLLPSAPQSRHNCDGWQTGEFSTAVLAGGSGASHGAERPRLAAKVSALSAASRTENREGGDGTQAGGPSLLDVAEGMGLRASEEVRFARGKARKSSGCAVDHRPNDWVSRYVRRPQNRRLLGQCTCVATGHTTIMRLALPREPKPRSSVREA